VAEKDIVIRAAERGTQFTLVLLFDLLNSSMQERGHMRQQLHSLLSPPPTGALALYLLDASGKLYPVGAPASGRDHADAIQALSLQAGALLDRALEKAPLTGPADLKNRVVRTKVTYRALDDLCSAIKPIPGKKRVRWIT
jgi:hypothetical protein